MNRALGRRRAFLVAIALIALAAIVYLVLFRGQNAGETATVRRGALEVTIETVGKLRARDPAVARTEVDGAIATVAVRPGDTVRQGDVLATLDRRPFDDAVQLAEQQVSDAEAALTVAEQSGGDNPTPEQTSERLAAAQRVNSARQTLEQARARIQSTMILAPRDGTVTDVPVATGMFVPGGSPVATVLDLGDLELTVDVDEVDLPHIEAGMKASFSPDAFPAAAIQGTIIFVSPVAQTTGGTTSFPSTISFDRPSGLALRPGMNANVTIQTAVRQDVLLVPEQALRTVGRRTFVTVVSDGKRNEREIQVGLRSEGNVEVAQGLQEGDRVLLR